MNLRDAFDRNKIDHALQMIRGAREGALTDRVQLFKADIDVLLDTVNAALSDEVLTLLTSLQPGEPMFIVLGRDPVGGRTVKYYVRETIYDSGSSERTQDVHELSFEFESYYAGMVTPTAPDAKKQIESEQRWSMHK